MRRIEYAHDDVPCVGDDEHRAEGLEDPLKEHPGIHIVQIVLVDHHLNELIAHDEGEDQPCNGDDDILRQGLDHGKDAPVPCGRRLSHFTGDFPDLRVHRVKHPRQIFLDTGAQDTFQPFGNLVDDGLHGSLPAAINRTGPKEGAQV